MRWQRPARLAIAIFVVVFAGVVMLTIRQRAATPDATPHIKREDPEALHESHGGWQEYFKGGKLVMAVKFGRHLGYADGRLKVADIALRLPDRNGRTVEVTAREADILSPTSGTVDSAEFRGDVRLSTSDGIVVTTQSANYTEKEGIVKVPGPVEFARGRMKGRGVGATYDKNRDVLWLLDQAHITVAPDAGGAGAAEATAGAAGLARAENYVRLTRSARIVADDRTIEADEATVLLNEGGETVQQVQLRANSRISGSGSDTHRMSARDIDLGYAPDGRTLQSARLMEDGVLELPGAAGRRITGRTIDIAMSPDGATLTSLRATENVQLDIPAEGDTAAKRIRSTTLTASGAAGQGLQHATFEGAVEYHETRLRPPAPGPRPPAHGDRTARANRLILDTKENLGALERADFRGNVRITDAEEITAEAPRALYHINGDQIELSLASGEPGPTPFVNDGQSLVEGRSIEFSPASHKLTADTNVRSILQPQRRNGSARNSDTPKGANSDGTAAPASKMPALLKQDKPVTVTANRLAYDGKSVATYSGNARLWQDASKIDADTIILDDQSGNLTARGNVRTTMRLEDVDPKTKQRTTSETIASADTMIYEDAKRLATYLSSGTTQARVKGAQGDLSGDRIELYLKPDGSELDRAEAHVNVVVLEGDRTARGAKLVYTAADDLYVLTGSPAEMIEREQQTCRKAVATTLRFLRSVDTIQVDGSQFPVVWNPIPCPAEPRS